MKKILYLTYDGLTDPLGQSQIIPYIIGLSKKGYQFTIVSFEKKENSASSSIIAEILREDGIAWIPLTYTRRPPVFSTVYDIFRLKRQATLLHQENRFHLIHCRSYITSLVGHAMKRKFKIKFIFDMRGFWADERVDGGLWNLRNPIFYIIYRFFKKKENKLTPIAIYKIRIEHD